MNRRRCVVLGATGGIGGELTRRLSSVGDVVHAIGRNRTALAALADLPRCVTHAVDLADRPAVGAVLAGIGDVDVLVAAAGAGGVLGRFDRADPAHIDEIMLANVLNTLHVVHGVLPGMIGRASGHVVVIGSTAGLHPVPSPVYAASKAATHHFLTSLSITTAGTGVRLTEVCPGRVATDCVSRANPAEAGATAVPDDVDVLQPDDVVDAVLFALDAPSRVSVRLIEIWPSGQALSGPRFVATAPDQSATRPL